MLDPQTARRLGAPYELLVPFLEQGATALVVPIATSAELLATLTVVSLDPARGGSVTSRSRPPLFVAGQAALAIDNARLTQERKDFADTMQRSLLPRGLPEVEGLEVGAVYESSARVEVGGDVYDFLTLPDGELAVVLGDVSGHGIAATADMALAKFAFRSLVRLYPDPAALLAQANEVAFGELAGGNFVTMACVTVDPDNGRRLRRERRTSADPRPGRRRLDQPPLRRAASRSGIEADQTYETARATLEAGAALCLFTDGLVEARRDGDQYGEERLHQALVDRPRALGAGARGARGRRMHAHSQASPTTITPWSSSAGRNCGRGCRERARGGGRPGTRARLHALRARVLHRGRGARDRDRRGATSRPLLRELDDRVGERHRPRARVALRSATGSAGRSRTAARAHACSGGSSCSRRC